MTAENVLVDSGSPTEPFVEEASERVGSQVVQLVGRVRAVPEVSHAIRRGDIQRESRAAFPNFELVLVNSGRISTSPGRWLTSERAPRGVLGRSGRSSLRIAPAMAVGASPRRSRGRGEGGPFRRSTVGAVRRASSLVSASASAISSSRRLQTSPTPIPVFASKTTIARSSG